MLMVSAKDNRTEGNDDRNNAVPGPRAPRNVKAVMVEITEPTTTGTIENKIPPSTLRRQANRIAIRVKHIAIAMGPANPIPHNPDHKARKRTLSIIWSSLELPPGHH